MLPFVMLIEVGQLHTRLAMLLRYLTVAVAFHIALLTCKYGIADKAQMQLIGRAHCNQVCNE